VNCVAPTRVFQHFKSPTCFLIPGVLGALKKCDHCFDAGSSVHISSDAQAVAFHLHFNCLRLVMIDSSALMCWLEGIVISGQIRLANSASIAASIRPLASICFHVKSSRSSRRNHETPFVRRLEKIHFCKRSNAILVIWVRLGPSCQVPTSTYNGALQRFRFLNPGHDTNLG
jgi:hypothetical protein